MSLSVETLAVTIGDKRLLNEVSVAFASGHVTAILGPNGAGKSTLMACLAGLMQPTGGRVLLDDRPRGDFERRDLARRVGYLPQEADVHWNVDVATLVGLGRFPHRGRWGETPEDRDAVTRAMAATDVGGFAKRGVSTLSGGERARVLLARVLAGEPDWLLADEPLANLDPAHQLDGLDALRRVAAAGAGVIVVLHDLNHAARVADDVLLLRDGRVVAFGPPDQVLTRDLVAATYGVDTHVGVAPGGRRFLIPTERLA
ncbi:ABC transporter ATP-binding protein [Microvirga sp. SRT01]|uniref:ABC transporter ATP-binding protein n=1 Tax=Sphingomonas longa TaxID=2778730 RepID=A0ABS2D7N7_9SPHN|nr:MULTISPECIES: ABC transporter ATP-binding protein [Alphaproteobacteria]MBM6576543.1 ABC transporter ATP-binding protein [Sphingomonas sp. BT552]MBR7709589.1 ABC transporter ATP-binding protein [Microvirga sp. SRT01]